MKDKLYLQIVQFDKLERIYYAEYTNGVYWQTKKYDIDSKIPTIIEI